MEIKRIKEESFESVSRYLDVLLSVVPNFYDLCFVDYDDKRYMVGIGDGKFAVVENDNGMLNAYSISQDDILKTEFNTEEKQNVIITGEDINEVVSNDVLTGDMQRISYLKAIDEYDLDVLEYAQYITKSEASLLTKYDVSKRGNLASSLVYTHFHNPDVIELRRLKKFLSFFYSKYDMYSLDETCVDNYLSPLINIGNVHIGVKPKLYLDTQLIDQLKNLEFKNMSDSYAYSIISGTNQEYNNISLITEEYKKYIKRQ